MNSSYILGWIDAFLSLGRCGANCPSQPHRPGNLKLCVLPTAHEGKHSDGKRLWGDSSATRLQNIADVVEFQMAHQGKRSFVATAEVEKDPVLSIDQWAEEDKLKLDDPEWKPPPDPERPASTLGPISPGQS